MGERKENEKAAAEVTFRPLVESDKTFLVITINCSCGEETEVVLVVDPSGHNNDDSWIVTCDNCPARYNLTSLIIEAM
jgi:hypothetical protein